MDLLLATMSGSENKSKKLTGYRSADEYDHPLKGISMSSPYKRQCRSLEINFKTSDVPRNIGSTLVSLQPKRMQIRNKMLMPSDLCKLISSSCSGLSFIRVIQRPKGMMSKSKMSMNQCKTLVIRPYWCFVFFSIPLLLYHQPRGMLRRKIR